MMSWGADFACSTELPKLDEVVALSPKKIVNALAGAQCAEQMLPFLQEINWYARQVIREDSMLALPMLRSLMPWDELIASAGWFGLLTHGTYYMP
jgi:hypothetical protein